MPPTVDFPTIVKQALELFGDVFDNEPARRHFAEYLTGLMVAERKNVMCHQSPIRRHHGSIMPQSLAGRGVLGCGGAQRPPSGVVTGQSENPLQPPRRHCH